MSNSSFHLGVLTGYLHATHAPAEVLDAVEALRKRIEDRIPNEQVLIPEPLDLTGLTETPQPEAKEEPGRGDGQKQENASGNTPGGFTHKNGEPYFVCPKTGRTFIKLRVSDLATIVEELKVKTFDQVGHLHNVTGGTLKAFLLANGIDPTQFSKSRGRQGFEHARGLARQAGQKRYKGKPCITCGGEEKFTSSGGCVKCIARRSAESSAKKKGTAPTVFPSPVPEASATDPASIPLQAREDGTTPDAGVAPKPAPKRLPVNYGGDNTYPNTPPYNYTHQPRYAGSALQGSSSAAAAVMGGA